MGKKIRINPDKEYPVLHIDKGYLIEEENTIYEIDYESYMKKYKKWITKKDS